MEFNLIGDLTVQRQKGPADKYTVMDATNGLNAAWNGVFARPVFGNGVAWDSRFITERSVLELQPLQRPHHQPPRPEHQ